MRLTWKDGLATVLVAVAVVVFAVWSAGACDRRDLRPRPGRGDLPARDRGVLHRAVAVRDRLRRQRHRQTAAGVRRAGLDAVGALATVAGIVALIVGGGLAVTTLLLAMIVMWILATVRHQLPHPAGRPAAAGR